MLTFQKNVRHMRFNFLFGIGAGNTVSVQIPLLEEDAQASFSFGATCLINNYIVISVR